MGTIADKLVYLAETKAEIAEAIEDKGVTVPEFAAFREYADFIRAIESGSGGNENLAPVTVTPTGQNFTVYPEDQEPPVDAFSSVNVNGDYNLRPENIAEGITVYGVTGTLQVRADMGSDIPAAYQEYFDRARQLYPGDYEHVMILEQSDYIGVGFMLPGFTVQSYDDNTTDFTASQWVYCGYKKDNGVWSVQDWSEMTSEGGNFIKNIRYCDTSIFYGTRQLYPFIVNGQPAVLPGTPVDPSATFTVTFMNGDEVLQVVENVPYGGYATYSGPTPEPPDPEQTYRIFTGWDPYPGQVRSDLVCYAQFYRSYLEGEVDTSWNEIVATRGASCAIGSVKLLEIGTVGGVNYGNITMRKVASGESGSTSTWLATKPLNVRHRMHDNYEQLAGWETSELRQWLNSVVLSALPETVRNAIVPVAKYSYTQLLGADDSVATIPDRQTTDYLWVPSNQEMTNDEYAETRGVYYRDYRENVHLSYYQYAWTRSSWGIEMVTVMLPYWEMRGSYPGPDYNILIGFCL